jgi:L-rhamnose isomerase
VDVTDPITLIVDEAFARVKVFANTLVVTRAFAEYTFKNDAVFEPAMDP